MADRTAFFYGTLMAREVLNRVIAFSPTSPRAHPLTITPALLHNYSRRKVKEADYPGIIAQAGHTVQGTFVSGLTHTDIGRLDHFEGREYTRTWVEVEVLGVGDDVGGEGVVGVGWVGAGIGGGEIKRAETYVYTYGLDELEDEEWDYEEFRREKLRDWTGPASVEYEGLDEVAPAPESGGVLIDGSYGLGKEGKI